MTDDTLLVRFSVAVEESTHTSFEQREWAPTRSLLEPKISGVSDLSTENANISFFNSSKILQEHCLSIKEEKKFICIGRSGRPESPTGQALFDMTYCDCV
jgi:hypothetical protein